MFRKSFQILFAMTLLTLAAILVYALPKFRGASDTLAEAEALLQAGEHGKAIKTLDLCETGASVRRDAALRQRLWRLRLQANSELDNSRGALLDVENLLADGLADDEALQLERIRLLAKADQGQRALQLARSFLETHPDHARALELAGLASQAVTQPQLERIKALILRDIGSSAEQRAREALLVYLHRPDGDVEVAQSLGTIEAIYAQESRLTANWQPLLRDLRELRQRVQEGLQFFRDSLVRNEQPVDAQTATVAAFDLAQRTDDLLMQCEIHRRGFADEHVAGSGSAAAWALVRKGAYGAAIATAERWLPSAALPRRIEAGTLGDGATDLWLARIVAAWRLDDRANLGRLYSDFLVLQRGKVEAPVPRHLLIGLLHSHKQEWKHAEGNLRYVVSLLLREPQRPDQIDLLSAVTPLRLDILRRSDVPPASVLAVFTEWLAERPSSLTAKNAFVRYLLETNQAPAAREILLEAAALDPSDHETFVLRLAVETMLGEQTGQSGDALLNQCIKRRSLVPDVTDPIGYMLCAQAAIGQQNFHVVRECARMAVEAFPRQRLPRLFEIDACLRTKRLTDAVELSRRLVESMPVDELAAWKALEAHLAAGQPIEPSLFRAMPLCAPSPELRTEVLRTALAHAPSEALAFALPVLQDPTAPEALRLLVARTAAAAGRIQDTRRLLDSVPVDVARSPAERDDRILATIGWIEASARDRADDDLTLATERHVGRLELRGAVGPTALLQAAARLAPTHPRTAYSMARMGLAAVDPESRNGAAHALAGRLAARLGMTAHAETHWLAALAFPDGRSIAADFARLCIALGRPERALLVHGLIPDPTDAALLAWAGNPEVARTLAAGAVARDGLDLLAHATLAALGVPNRSDWQPADATTNEARLELLALLGTDTTNGSDLGPTEVGTDAVQRATAILAADPMSTTSQLLLARAHLLAGSFAAAAAIHASLCATGPDLLWRELAVATNTKGYTLPPAAAVELLGAMAAGKCLDSATATVAAMRRIADGLTASGDADGAQRIRELMWLQHPRDGFRVATDLEALATVSHPRMPWIVLDLALGSEGAIPLALRGKAREHFAKRAAERMADAATDPDEVYGAMLRHVATEGPYGCLVHFLLDHGDRAGALRPDEAGEHSLLLQQLGLVATGRDPGPWMDRSIDRLLRSRGPVDTLADIETLLQQYPTSLPLWRARTEVMARQQRATIGVAQLRNVLRHAEAPPEALALVTLAAVEGLFDPADQKVLDALPKELLASADGHFTRGLVYLRAGKPDDAIGLLAKAGARDDGMHLFLRALANLQSRDPKGAETAQALLAELARDYPSSSRARNAGNFASQLLPR